MGGSESQVSEYQYYEFAAVDRPLDGRQLDELRALSTRADITSTSFVNSYQWGDFRGDPRVMMEKYFDAFLYLANWGTRQVMLRLPVRLLDIDTAKRYCRSTRSRARPAAETWFSMPLLRMRPASTATSAGKGRSPPSCRSVPK